MHTFPLLIFSCRYQWLSTSNALAHQPLFLSHTRTPTQTQMNTLVLETVSQKMSILVLGEMGHDLLLSLQLRFHVSSDTRVSGNTSWPKL